MAKNFLLEYILIVIAQLIAIAGAVWKAASMYGELREAIRQNKKDLNQGLSSLRESIRRKGQITEGRIYDIEEHLHDKDNYRVSSIRIYDDYPPPSP